MKRMKRWLAALLVAVMVLTLAPFSALTVVAAAGDTIVVGDDGIATNIVWEPGYIGSPTNAYAGPWATATSKWTSSYRRTQVFTVPKAGTMLIWSESAAAGAQSNGAMVVSSWKLENGTWVVDQDGTYAVGAGKASTAYINYNSASGTLTYTYVTASDNEHLVLGAYGGKPDGSWTSSSDECPKVTVILPTAESDTAVDAVTIEVGENNAVTNAVWVPGYIGSGTNQAIGQAWHTFDRAWEVGGRLTNYLIVPDAYTTLVWSESTAAGTLSTDMQTVTSFKQSGDGYVIDQSRMQIMGDGDTARGIQYVEDGVITYAYTTTHANEIVRLGCYGGLSDRSLTTSSADCPTVYAYRAVFEGETVSGVRWFNGSVDTSYNTTYHSTFTKKANNYIHTMPIAIPKAGTTLYITDTASNFAASDVFVFSVWASAADGSLSEIYGLRGGNPATEPHITTWGSGQRYTYTSSYDNEVIRICYRTDRSLTELDSVAGIYFETDTDNVRYLQAAGYRDGYTGEQFLPEVTFTRGGGVLIDGTASENGMLMSSAVFSVFAPGTTIAVTDAAGFAADNVAVFASYSAKSGGTLLGAIPANKPFEAGVGGYKDNADGTRTYYYVTAASETFLRITLSAEGNLTTDGKTVAPVINTVASAAADYSDVLTGLRIYSLGDSYFAGVNIDRSTIWISRMARQYDMTYYNYHISGSTVTAKGDSSHASGSNAMVTRYTNMPNDASADIVIFEGGRNDYNYGAPMGTVGDKNTTTFYGSLRTVIDGLLSKYPNAVILCVTAWDLRGRNESANAEGYVTSDYVDAYVNLYNALYADNPRVKLVNNGDSTQFPVYMLNSDFQATYNMTATDISHFHCKGHAYVLPYFEQVLAEKYVEYQDEVSPTAVTAADAQSGVSARQGTFAAGTMVLPAVDDDTFVGWSAEVGGEKLLLPAGASYRYEKGENTVFTAVRLHIGRAGAAEAVLTDAGVGLRFFAQPTDEAEWALLTAAAAAVQPGMIAMLTENVTQAPTRATAGVAELAAAFADGMLTADLTGVTAAQYLKQWTVRAYATVTYADGTQKDVYAAPEQQAQTLYAAVSAAWETADEAARAALAPVKDAVVCYESVDRATDSATMALTAGQKYQAVTVRGGADFAAYFAATGDAEAAGFSVITAAAALDATNVAGVMLDGKQITYVTYYEGMLLVPLYDETGFY